MDPSRRPSVSLPHLDQLVRDELLFGTSNLLVVVLLFLLLVLELLLLLCILLLLLQLGLLLGSPLLVPQLLQLFVREVSCGETKAVWVFLFSDRLCVCRSLFPSLCLTSVGLQLFAVVNQWIVVEAQVNLDGRDGGLVVKRMHPEHVLQLQ